MSTAASPPAGPRIVATCSFCHRPNTEVGTLVAGHGVFICDGCVALCAEIVAGRSAARPAEGAPQLAPWEHDVPLEDVLAQLGPTAAAGAQVERNLGGWVQKARSLGATWAQVGGALGISRQSAWERFAPGD